MKIASFLHVVRYILCLSPFTGRAAQNLRPRACKKVDGRQILGKAAINFTRPTIITNIMTTLFPSAGAAWQEAQLKRQFSKESVTCHHLGGGSCYDFNGNLVVQYEQPVRLTKVLQRLIPFQWDGVYPDIPKNLFILDHHPIVKKLVASVVNDSSPVPILRKVLDSLHTPRMEALSLGREGQWNHMHRHEENLSVQMAGRKGWVMLPGKNMPKKLISRTTPEVINEDAEPGSFDQTSLCRYVMSCERWAEFADADPNAMCQPEMLEGAKREYAVSRYKGFACTVEQGEALFVPFGWWHGTCNLDTWNAGFTFISRALKRDLEEL